MSFVRVDRIFSSSGVGSPIIIGYDRGTMTLAEAVASTDLVIGQYLKIVGRPVPYKVVTAATGTADGGAYIDLVGITGQLEAQFDEAVYLSQWGVVGTGDELPKVQSAIDYSEHVKIDVDFTVSDSLTLQGMQKLEPIGDRTLICTHPTNPLFDYQTSGASADPVFIDGFNITANRPIRINDETGTISDGDTSQAPIIGGSFRHNVCRRYDSGSGKGFTAAKVFDMAVEHNRFIDFDVWHIGLWGCDINKVENNRIEKVSKFGIIEVQQGTFGSQNSIKHNDIIGIKATTANPIKSVARHVVIHNNYIETTLKDGFASTGSVVIDVSKEGTDPARGGAFSGTIFHIDIDDNRLDSNSTQIDETYVIDSGFRSLKLHAPGTTGTVYAPSRFTSNPSFAYNSTHKAKIIDIRGHHELCPNTRTEESVVSSVTGDRLIVDIDNLRAVDYRDNTPNDITLDLPNKAFIIANQGRTSWFNVVGYGAFVPSINMAGTVSIIAKSSVAAETGTHNGSGNSATLSDSTQSWTTDEHVGKTVYNTTDGSSGVITANTATTVTATLSGGVDNDWDVSDGYHIGDRIRTAIGNNTSGTTAFTNRNLTDKYEKFSVRAFSAGDAFVAQSDSRVAVQSLTGNTGVVSIKAIIVSWT